MVLTFTFSVPWTAFLCECGTLSCKNTTTEPKINIDKKKSVLLLMIIARYVLNLNGFCKLESVLNSFNFQIHY